MRPCFCPVVILQVKCTKYPRKQRWKRTPYIAYMQQVIRILTQSLLQFALYQLVSKSCSLIYTGYVHKIVPVTVKKQWCKTQNLWVDSSAWHLFFGLIIFFIKVTFVTLPSVLICIPTRPLKLPQVLTSGACRITNTPSVLPCGSFGGRGRGWGGG